ncbi:MAG: 1-acyl-sn-glycerol-3-phosphate acyltransferase [Candidatus Aminicenantes bacterium]|nr:1-acyl-sn-glycerol-3-phosphate acyltransferase [Candidatus Aminicenantes bacterium]
MATFEEELERFRKPIRRLTNLALFPKKIVVRGEENWVRQGPNLIVGNHIGSYKDVGLLLRVVPRPIFFTANEDLFDYLTFSALVSRHLNRHLHNFGPFVHMLLKPFYIYVVQYISSNIRRIGTIPVNLDGSRMDAVRKCEALLRQDRAVIALQGHGRVKTRDPNPYVMAFRRGPAVMAHDLYTQEGISLAVTPLSFFGTHLLWGVPARIRVNVGPPMYIKDHLSKDVRESIEKFRRALEDTVSRLFLESIRWEI